MKFKLNRWKSTGPFKDFQQPKMLQAFLKWTKLGFEFTTTEISPNTSITCNIILASFKLPILR